MARLYFRKIRNKEINFITGETWQLEDVPHLWKQQVQEMLNNDGNEV